MKLLMETTNSKATCESKTLDEMSEEERQELGNRAYELLVQLWESEHSCRIVMKGDNQ